MAVLTDGDGITAEGAYVEVGGSFGLGEGVVILIDGSDPAVVMVLPLGGGRRLF